MTKELEQAARRLVDNELAEGILVRTMTPFQIADIIAAHTRTQLRQQLADLERRGYAGHKDNCAAIPKAAFTYRGVEKVEGPCDCGWDEMKRELEGK